MIRTVARVVVVVVVVVMEMWKMFVIKGKSKMR